LAADETALVVTHGGPIRAVLAAATDRELTDVARECSPSNCGVTVLEPDGGRTRVRARDDCAHL
jgi:broad specificity phosphatase PhoE